MHCLHCVERHIEDLRDSVQVHRGKSEREHTWGGWFFFFSRKSGMFFEGPFRCRYICCQADRFTGGTLYLREAKGSQVKCFISNCQRHLVKITEDKIWTSTTVAPKKKQTHEIYDWKQWVWLRIMVRWWWGVTARVQSHDVNHIPIGFCRYPHLSPDGLLCKRSFCELFV